MLTRLSLKSVRTYYAVLIKFNHILPKLHVAPSIIARSVWLLPEQVRPNLYCLPRVLARIANSGVCISDLFCLYREPSFRCGNHKVESAFSYGMISYIAIFPSIPATSPTRTIKVKS